MTKKSTEPRKGHLVGRIALLKSGIARLIARRDDALFDISLGPHYFASVTRKEGQSLQEVTACRAANAAAYMITTVRVEKGKVERHTRTEYASKTAREDTFLHRHTSLTRSAN